MREEFVDNQPVGKEAKYHRSMYEGVGKEERLFKAKAVNEVNAERDRATPRKDKIR
jgi:hypothetical protein